MNLYLSLAVASSLWRWLRHLGGPGLILLGLADNSIIPLPGSMDVFTIWLSAHHRNTWLYYAGMATLGSVIGGYVTYGLARKGGKQTLETRLSKRQAERVYAGFERWGFGAVAVPALLPPPFPVVPFLLAAGAMQYSRRKFLGALAIGRGIRFSVLAFLGATYGSHIIRFFSRYYKPALGVVLVLVVFGAGVGLHRFFKYRRDNQSSRSHSTARAEEVA